MTKDLGKELESCISELRAFLELETASEQDVKDALLILEKLNFAIWSRQPIPGKHLVLVPDAGVWDIPHSPIGSNYLLNKYAYFMRQKTR